MRLSRYPGLAVAIALVGLLCFAGTTALYAQTTSASVFGSVKDSQGGVLPGATVTLTSPVLPRPIAWGKTVAVPSQATPCSASVPVLNEAIPRRGMAG